MVFEVQQKVNSFIYLHYTICLYIGIFILFFLVLFYKGEALNSICAVTESTQITTKTENDPVAILYTLDHSGKILQYVTKIKISHRYRLMVQKFNLFLKCKIIRIESWNHS